VVPRREPKPPSNFMAWKRDAAKLFASIATMQFTGPPRIAYDEADGLAVSTVNTYDMGYETAIRDAERAIPVQRYKTEQEALAGHAAWLAKLPTITKVTYLGYGELVEPEVVTVKRKN
jgi:hypothetical protein